MTRPTRCEPRLLRELSAKTMAYNSSQKAQQALEELTKDGTLENRLRLAWGYLIQAGGPDYAQDASSITEAFKKGSKALEKEDYHALGTAIQEMIEAIFVEEGANQVRSQFGQ